MTKVNKEVREITEEIFGSAPFKIGDIVEHPDGYKVKIVDGRYWGTYGISNHWSWRRVWANGKLSKVVSHGYGWRPK